MAAAFSGHCSFSQALPAAKSTSKSPKMLTLALPLHHAAGSKLFSAFRIEQNSRKMFRTALKVAATDQKTINGNEQNQTMDNMKLLTQAYKEAFLNGDEKSVCEIEAQICILEKEKHELHKKSTDLTSEIASLKEKFLRLTADFENLRKRSEKYRHTFTSDARAEVIESLLPIIDNFERVKQQMKPETEREKKFNTSYQGIYKQLVEIMRSMSVSVVDTVGRPFDPSIHEAVAREESKQFKSGIVTQEIRRGFVITDRVLRPASVKVSTGPGLEKVSSFPANSVKQPENVEQTQQPIAS